MKPCIGVFRYKKAVIPDGKILMETHSITLPIVLIALIRKFNDNTHPVYQYLFLVDHIKFV